MATPRKEHPAKRGRKPEPDLVRVAMMFPREVIAQAEELRDFWARQDSKTRVGRITRTDVFERALIESHQRATQEVDSETASETAPIGS